MSLTSLINDFYVALFAYKNNQWNGKAVHAARALGIDDNTYSQAYKNLNLFGRYPQPRRKALLNVIAKTDGNDAGRQLKQAAEKLRDALAPTDDEYVLITELPLHLKEFAAKAIKGKAVPFRELEKLLMGPRLADSTSSSGRDLPTLIKQYTHVALQLKTGAFVNVALARELYKNDDIGALEACAMIDLIQGFADLRYFRALTGAVWKKENGTPYSNIPLHPFAVIEPSTIMREPARATDSEELKVLRSLTREDGGNTSFIFYEHNEKRPRYTASEIVTLVGTFVPEPLGLYALLNPELRHEQRELAEPAVVCAGASVAAMRLTLSLMAATRTLIGLRQKSTWLDAVASKAAELSRHSYEEVAARMQEALDRLEYEPDRTALEREVALTITALFREEGAWFIFNDREAFLNRCGSLVLGSVLQGELGKEYHRFLEAWHSCKLPDTHEKGDPIWIFRGAAGISLQAEQP
jgi:hypothetical protein